VAHDPDAVAAVRRPDVSSTHHERPCGVARRFQVAEHGICAATAQSRHVLDEHPAWPKLADDPGEFAPESAAVPALDPGAAAGGGDVLAGEAAGDEVDALEGGGAGEPHIPASGDGGPVSGEDVLTVGLRLHLPAHHEAGALEPERHAPDPGKEIAACHEARFARRAPQTAGVASRIGSSTAESTADALGPFPGHS
jgi:hypothetical protein